MKTDLGEDVALAKTMRVDPEGTTIEIPWFSIDPTARGDEIAWCVRQWYEKRRETWWERHTGRGVDIRTGGAIADEFMLRFVEVVRLVTEEAVNQQLGLERQWGSPSKQPPPSSPASMQ